MANGVSEDRDGWHLIYRNQLIRVKTRRKIAAIAMVDSQSSQPLVALFGSMDSVGEVFSVLWLRGGSRKDIPEIIDFTSRKCVYGVPIWPPKVLSDSDSSVIRIDRVDICNDDEEGGPEACADECLSDVTHCNIPHQCGADALIIKKLGGVIVS